MKGLLMGLGLGLGANIVFGVAEGPYYYDPEQHTPEEYEFHKSALSRFLYKYWFTSQRVAHWQTYAGMLFQDETRAKDRLIQDVRRISAQTGAIGMSSGYYNHAQNVGGVADKHAYLHATAPQLLNEMIQYADENEILRAKDQIIQKVIVEKGEGALRQGVTVEFNPGETLRLPAVGVAPSPHLKPDWYNYDVETKDQ